MTAPRFIAWLDGQMAAFGNGKLVPQGAVLTTDLSDTLEHRLNRRITKQLLREAGIDTRVAAALQEIALPPATCAQQSTTLCTSSCSVLATTIAWIADQLLAADGARVHRRSTVLEGRPEPRGCAKRLDADGRSALNPSALTSTLSTLRGRDHDGGAGQARQAIHSGTLVRQVAQ